MPHLTSADLITYEAKLRSCLAQILSFSSASLYFPPGEDPGSEKQPGQVLHEDDLLLVPLLHAGQRLGMFRITGVPREQGASLAPVLPHLLSSCLKVLELEIEKQKDHLTGLWSEQTFMAQLTQHIEQMADSLQPGLTSVDDTRGSQRPDFVLFIFDVTRMTALNRRAGHAFGDQLLQSVGAAIQSAAGPQGLVSRMQGDSFALLLPGIGPSNLESQAQKILQAVHGLGLDHPLTEAKVRPRLSAGGVHYPQDVSGRQLRYSPWEQGCCLIALARQCQKRALDLDASWVMTPSQVLHSGGRIAEIHSPARVRIDLGAAHRARSGQHFRVIPQSGGTHPPSSSSPPALGAELRLVQVEDESSLAEVLHAPVPEQAFSIRDRLSLISGAQASHWAQLEEDTPSYPHRRIQTSPDLSSFLKDWGQLRSREARFTLSMIHAPMPGLRAVLTALHRLADTLPDSSLLSRYSSTTLLIYLPGQGPEETASLVQSVVHSLEDSLQQDTAVGIGFYPCLNWTRGETLSLAKLALEHALCLPRPAVASFDSITLTLQGDRFFAAGDLRQAMQEYNRALLLDAGNNVARNSLAICLAQVGEYSQACTEFRSILDQDEANYMAHYNYGYVCLKLRDREQARTCFHTCLQLMPEHAFSLLRLGQMAEEEGNLDQAHTYCQRAAEAGPHQGAPFRVLGRLAWKGGDYERARSCLHQALVANPQDPDALRLLAHLTLDQGHDPEVAVSLLRKSLHLQPNHQESTALLDRALQAQGQ